MCLCSVFKKAEEQMKKVSTIAELKVLKRSIRTWRVLQYGVFVSASYAYKDLSLFSFVFSVFYFTPLRMRLHRTGKPQGPRA